MQYYFEWDPRKAKQNLTKHRVSFERASEVFRDPLALSIYDQEHSRTEERWITLGNDSNAVPVVVIHTFRQEDENNCTIRIISARKATKNEAKWKEREATKK